MSLALIVEIVGDASKLGKSLEGAKSDVAGLGASLPIGQIAAVAGVAAIAGAAILGMTEAAAADRDEQDKLNAVIRAATGSTADYTAEIDAAIAAGQERAFTDSDTRAALQSLVTATGDVTTATALLSQTQDIARLAGVDLATAADAVAKAQAGQDGPLRKLIPGLEKGATATETLALATAKAAGQADTFAASSAGMAAKSGDALGELGETIGTAFLPVLDALLPILIQLIRLLGQLIQAVLPAIIPIIKLLAGALTIAGNVLSIVVGWVIKLVKWLGDAIGVLETFLSKINPLQGLKLPSLPFLSSSPSSAGAGVGRAAGRAATSGSVGPATVNVYTTGDGIEAEQAVARALRRVLRINGGVVPAVGWAGN